MARGETAEARRLLRAHIARVTPDVEVWLKLAALCRGLGDLKEALAATVEALKIEPLNFLALLLLANLMEKTNAPGFGEAYGQALAQHRANDTESKSLSAMIEHAKCAYAEYQQRQNDILTQALLKAHVRLSEAEAGRVARFQSNALRLTKVYHAEPVTYAYPGLAEREFHDRSDFEWLERLEEATDAIIHELEALIAAEHAVLTPYIQYDTGQPLRQWQALNHSHDWTAIHLLQNGKVIDANARHCPVTMDLLRSFPQPDITGASPNAMFSLLAPHTHIPPHNGIANTRLVCHLPLTVPSGCWFRVGAQSRNWVKGEAWVFDDCIEHEAKNESDTLRVVFIFDIWHPGLNRAEQEAISALVAADAK